MTHRLRPGSVPIAMSSVSMLMAYAHSQVGPHAYLWWWWLTPYVSILAFQKWWIGRKNGNAVCFKLTEPLRYSVIQKTSSSLWWRCDDWRIRGTGLTACVRRNGIKNFKLKWQHCASCLQVLVYYPLRPTGSMKRTLKWVHFALVREFKHQSLILTQHSTITSEVASVLYMQPLTRGTASLLNF